LEKKAKNEKFSAAPMPKPEVELRNWNDVPVDSVRVRNRRKFGVAATKNRKPVLAH